MLKATDTLQTHFIEQPPASLWAFISPLYCIDEESWLQELLSLAKPDDQQLKQTTQAATQLIQEIRQRDNSVSMIDAFLLEYSLDTKEGVLLMCLAEALMRIPDKATADAFIKDRLSVADWAAHAQKSDSLLVNAATWGLLLTGKVVAFGSLTLTSTKLSSVKSAASDEPNQLMKRMLNRLSEPVIRRAMLQAMKIMGHQFVLGRSIKEALTQGQKHQAKGYRYSFDMLGEAALTTPHAEQYLAAYMQAIDAAGKTSQSGAERPTVSVKLSALHPRYEANCEARVMTELFENMQQLIRKARQLNIGITIDAEEANRLELSLQLFEKLYLDESTQGWDGFGLVVQAYSKRALAVLTWLASLGHAQEDKIPLRLVKGAYWDSEIKLCQQKGITNYPVYTRKEATDVAYLACARFLLQPHIRKCIFPQFASHNAHTVASILCMAETAKATPVEFELQRLHGMGDALYDHLIENTNNPVRIYAPVGSHKDLLPYLVRRLLENGANSSFVHRLIDSKQPISQLVEHPAVKLTQYHSIANPAIPLPTALFHERKNSFAPNIEIASQWQPYQTGMAPFMEQNQQWQAYPIIAGEITPTLNKNVVNSPYDHTLTVGEVDWADEQQVTQAIKSASSAFSAWSNCPVSERAACLVRMADLLEQHCFELMALCHREAGKTIQDSLDEIREAVDFCRYYAQQAQHTFVTTTYTDYLGKTQRNHWSGRGVFVCISPWNFPLAIFLGQIAAALVSGNAVIAKPAEQTSLIAFRAIELFHQAGIPTDALHFLPGNGRDIGTALLSDPRIAGVAFTGSTATAQLINRTLAARDTAPIPFIAETGGQNAMLVDATALPEQVVRDVVRSAFMSAGQRCSALRVLFLQQDIADTIITMLQGAMAELSVGLPYLHSTDVGPVIDHKAQSMLLEHIRHMQTIGRLIHQTILPKATQQGTFVAPTAFEIQHLDQLQEEKFGPILHVIRYQAQELDHVIGMINQSGFGLTMGIHSRNETTCAHIVEQARVGNIYINRDQIGAVVGVQPFGGQGLSGTGPKAGGPHYLAHFAIAANT
ncbi:bifunctional proline dehydrogenase/L-glutamate gamma-semialdehyde dehydrogenase PutA [Marinomonas agarivorans]|nr:bifunctional proline dehydrogenase/L-glutamate gamma-semialdehyde dehydrogenase PutA [Marinomonas agarivorans]